MSEALDEYLALERHQLCISPWSRSVTISGWLGELRTEIDEVLEAIDAGDRGAIVEELGDVLSDAIHAVLCAEKQGLCSFDGVLRASYDKMVRRKPWLIDGSPVPVTIEEESVLWNRIKALEKKR